MRFGMWGDVRSLIRLVRRQRFLPTPLVCLVLLLVAGGAGSSASAAGTVPWHGIIRQFVDSSSLVPAAGAVAWVLG